MIDERFSRAARLLRKQEFERVLKQRQYQVNVAPFLLLGIRATVARLGIIVGKRHLARAADRNLVKRLVRESFRRWRWRLPAVDLVVMLRQRVPALDRAALHRQIEALWHGLIEKARPIAV